MKDWYKRYINWIVIILFVLLCFKGCQSCSRQSALKWNTQKYEYKIDSLSEYIIHQTDSIHNLKDSIRMYQFKMGLVEKDNKRLMESNRQIQRNNNILINTNNQIINKSE